MQGNIHSIESFGTVDGPGIRFVVFMAGCPMRCMYCHNPDTWSMETRNLMSVSDIKKQYDGVKEFLKHGGITVTGGEPLVQMDFLIELFKGFKEDKVNTCLDTSGICFDPKNHEKMDELIKYVDLVMLDIKHIDDTMHKKITGHSNKNILEFAKYLSQNNINLWIRHVVVKGLTDDEESLTKLGLFIKTLKTVKALDVLPYHTMGVFKYKELNIPYPLEGVPDLTKEECVKARNVILKAIKN